MGGWHLLGEWLELRCKHDQLWAFHQLHRHMTATRDRQWGSYAQEAEAYWVYKGKEREAELVAELQVQEEKLNRLEALVWNAWEGAESDPPLHPLAGHAGALATRKFHQLEHRRHEIEVASHAIENIFHRVAHRRALEALRELRDNVSKAHTRQLAAKLLVQQLRPMCMSRMRRGFDCLRHHAAASLYLTGVGSSSFQSTSYQSGTGSSPTLQPADHRRLQTPDGPDPASAKRVMYPGFMPGWPARETLLSPSVKQIAPLWSSPRPQSPPAIPVTSRTATPNFNTMPMIPMDAIKTINMGTLPNVTTTASLQGGRSVLMQQKEHPLITYRQSPPPPFQAVTSPRMYPTEAPLSARQAPRYIRDAGVSPPPNARAAGESWHERTATAAWRSQSPLAIHLQRQGAPTVNVPPYVSRISHALSADRHTIAMR